MKKLLFMTLILGSIGSFNVMADSTDSDTATPASADFCNTDRNPDGEKTKTQDPEEEVKTEPTAGER